MNHLPTGLLLLSILAAPALAAPPAQPDDGPERLVVSFHRMPEGLQAHGSYLGADVLAVDPVLGFASVSAADARAFREQANGRPEVRLVEEDPVVPLVAFMPNDPEFASSQYGPQLIGAPAAWETTLGSADVNVCVVDTGVRHTHQDLAARWAGGIDLVNGDNDPMDDNGHGTHVAGIATATTGNGLGIAGVAQASLKAVKVLDAAGSGAMSTVASGIRWCADNGARVINLSLGGPSGVAVLRDAVDYAWGKGALLVAAAGNGGCTGCVLYPAAYEHVIAVGCVDQSAAVCSWTSQGPEVDLAAPGNAIQSTWWTSDSAYMRAAGTSMSTPHVAGAAALVWAAHPGHSNFQVREALESTAQDAGTPGKDAATGFGIARADLAISAVAAPPPPAPAVHGVAISPSAQSKQVSPKGTVTYSFQVQNTGNGNDTFSLARSNPKQGWTAAVSPATIALAPGATATVTVTVTASKSGSWTATLTATSVMDSMAKATAMAATSVVR